MRKSDRWLSGLVLFLIAIVIAVGYVGFTALRRQQQATCYQLVAVERQADRERRAITVDPANAEQHRQAEAATRAYAAGLRAIVPRCPRQKGGSDE